ncbi:MAG: hypothetical protein MI757_04590 [Pirellulales bacterium]|nr:hypothetical protein [Pirellulales bacterium]
MTNDRLDAQSRLAELLSASCTDALTDAERKELDALLVDNQVARRDYLDYCQMHAELLLSGRAQHATDTAFALIRAEDSEPSTNGNQPSAKEKDVRPSATAHASPLTAGRSLREFVRHHNLAVAVAVAFVAVASMVGWMAISYLPGLATNEDEPAARANDDVIAGLVRVHDIEWTNGGVPESTQYKSGQRLAIDSGILEIRYLTGATVVIEGPAEFVVGGEQSAFSGQQSANEETARSSTPHPSILNPLPIPAS